MVNKDWILLLVPIISNGLLVWFLQHMIQLWLKRNEKCSDLRDDIFREYISKIIKAKSACRALSTARGEAKITNDLSALDNAVITLRSTILELCEYYDDYAAVLSTDRRVQKEYIILKNRFEQWVFNWENVDIACDFLKDCEMILQDILDRCLTHLYRIRKFKRDNAR